MGSQNRTNRPDLGQMASRAHGVVTRPELLGAGLSDRQITRRVQAGLLIVEFPGVYRVGHRAPSPAARYMAAVKACGPGARLSGLAAAWLWALIRGPAPTPEVTTATERRVPGIETRRRRNVSPKDSTERHGIPVTTVPVTLIRLPSLLSFDELAKAVHEADVRYGTRPEHIEAALERHRKAKGRQTLLAVARGDLPTLLSELEKRFHALLKSHGLPLPETNRPKGAGYVDCRWPGRRLTVELDSYRFHRSRHAWEKDHQREREARARDDEFRRYTWHDVVENPDPTVRDLRPLLGAP